MFLLAACQGGGGNTFVSDSQAGDTTALTYATNLTLVERPGYVEATVRNPWDTTKTLHRYLLVPDSVEMPSGLPEGTVIRTPLQSALIYSSVHNSLVAELGSIGAISGVCDAEYIHLPELKQRIATGKVVDCGISTSPNIEKILSLNPGAIMLSPFENSGAYGKVGQMGIPIVECADYMETSPLGRAEWMKFYGMLFGRTARADSLFSQTEREYLALKQLTDTIVNRPSVLMDMLYGQVWYVPAAVSTMGIFITDAGGKNPFDNFDKSGSAALTAEQVLMKAGDADLWLLRYSQSSPKTLAELGRDNAVYSQFKAFKDRQVYGCNTSDSDFFEDVPFHPQWLLANLISIIHPQLGIPANKQYFKHLD